MTPHSLISVILLVSARLCEASLTLNSTRFIHILKWDQEPKPTNGLCYTVEYYGLNSALKKTVPRCECILHPECNLTEALSDVKETYYIHFITTLGNHTLHNETLEAFKPIEDTILDPPLLIFSSCGDSMCVDLKPPSDSLLSVYETFTYTLTIRNTKNGFQFSEEPEGLKHLNLGALAQPGTEYCVTVSVKDRRENRAHTECASTTSSYRPETVPVIFVVVLVAFIVIFLLCNASFCTKPTLPNVLNSIKHHSSECVLLNPSAYDIPAFSRVSVKDPTNSICQSRDDEEKSHGEDGSEQAVMETKKSTGHYERRTGQMDCSTQDVDDDSPFLPVSPPSDVTENCLLPEFSTITGSEDIPFKIHSGAHITNQHSQDQCVREQGSRSVFCFGSSESVIDEEECAEEEDEGSCPDINLLSVTLGKHEEGKPEEQDYEDALQGSCPEEQNYEDALPGSCPEEQNYEDALPGSCPDVNLLSITLGKHKEGKPEERDTEDALLLDSPLWWEGGDPSLPLLTDMARSSDTEAEEEGEECSDYLKR